MSRGTSISVLALALSHLGGGTGSSNLLAQRPYVYAPSHPYLTMVLDAQLRSRFTHVAARFEYNPYLPTYSRPQKPFEPAAAAFVTGIRRGGASDRYAYLLSEYADELAYYGFDDFAVYLSR